MDEHGFILLAKLEADRRRLVPERELAAAGQQVLSETSRSPLRRSLRTRRYVSEFEGREQS